MYIYFNNQRTTEKVNVLNGRVTRLNPDGSIFHEGSDNWTVLEAQITNNFGKTVKSLTLRELYDLLRLKKESLFHKNGRAKFQIVDLDHGTIRVWSKRFRNFDVHASVE